MTGALTGQFLSVTFVLALFIIAGGTPVASQAVENSVATSASPPAGSILTLSSDRLFSESLFGQRIAKEIEAQSAVLGAENRRIESELVLEEQELTRKRSELSAEAFRILADAFDEKVQTIRREQKAKARTVTEKQELSQIQFLEAARPVLVQIMLETGATVILERASVLMSANASDVTDFAIERINATLGDGANAPNP